LASRKVLPPAALAPEDHTTSKIVSLSGKGCVGNWQVHVLACLLGVLTPKGLGAQEDPDKRQGRKEQRREDELRRRATRSEFFQDLVQEVEGAPEEARPRTVPTLLV